MLFLFQAVFGRRRIQTFYDQCVFRAGTGVALSQSRFVSEFEKAYKKDKEGLMKELRAGYKSTIPIPDMNLNCKLDSNEVILGMSSEGFDDQLADLEYFNSFNNAQSIPVSEYIDVMVRFFTNTNEDDAEIEAKEAFIERSDLTSSLCHWIKNLTFVLYDFFVSIYLSIQRTLQTAEKYEKNITFEWKISTLHLNLIIHTPGKLAFVAGIRIPVGWMHLLELLCICRKKLSHFKVQIFENSKIWVFETKYVLSYYLLFCE